MLLMQTFLTLILQQIPRSVRELKTLERHYTLSSVLQRPFSAVSPYDYVKLEFETF